MSLARLSAAARSRSVKDAARLSVKTGYWPVRGPATDRCDVMAVMQARAEATRRTILDTAVDLFGRLGFANVQLVDLLAATHLSKGAFYYHFPNRESVATAIIEEADAKLRAATVDIFADSSSPMMANFIRSVFAVADLNSRDPLVRVGVELRGGLGHISPASEGYAQHVGLFTDAVREAIAQGDLRAGMDAEPVAFTLWSAILGTYQHCEAAGEDLRARLAEVLEVIIPGICTPDSAQEYLRFVSDAAGQRVS